MDRETLKITQLSLMTWLDRNVESYLQKLLAKEYDDSYHEWIVENANAINDLSEAWSEASHSVAHEQCLDTFPAPDCYRAVRKVWQVPVISDTGIDHGMIDLIVTMASEASLPNSIGLVQKRIRHFSFLIRPVMENILQTIGEVNLLERHSPDTQFCVVSPDGTYEALLESQNIKFVRTPHTERVAVENALAFSAT